MDEAQATSPKQDADAYLAACTALLLAIAQDSYLEESQHLETLLDSMPDIVTSRQLQLGLVACGLRPDVEHG